MSDVIKRYIVQGKVQGVFFRASTRNVALGLGLLGWAKNCTDSSVEVVVIGPENAVLELENWLQHGPRHARVDSLEIEIVSSLSTLPAGFAIL